jgi:hypothetical protein
MSKRRRRLKEPPLQALRIPTGWRVGWNRFFDVEPEFKTYDQASGNFDEDILQMENEWAGVLIDLGWYPSCKWPGAFRLVVIRRYEDHDQMCMSWDKPLRSLRTRSKEKVVRTLERWLEWYAEHFVKGERREPAKGRKRRKMV